MTVTCLVLLPVFYYNEELLYLIFNLKNHVLSDIFMIFMISVPFTILSQLIGYPLLAAFGFSAYANNSLIYSALIYLILVVLVTFFFNDVKLIALCMIFHQVIGVSFRLYYVKKNKIWTIQKN